MELQPTSAHQINIFATVQDMIKNTDSYRQIGINLKNIRLSRRQSQMDIGAITEYSRQYIGKIETGKARITLNVLFRLATCLKITSKELFSGLDI